MARNLAGIVLASIIGSTASAQVVQPAHSYERQGQDWYRVESGGKFRVDPDVISVRFRAPIKSLAQFQLAAGELPGEAGGAIARLARVRSNALGIHDLRLPAGTDLFAVLDVLRASRLVEFAEENVFGDYLGVPDESQFGKQWHLNNTGQTGGTIGADIDALEAWDVTVGSPSIIIAELDSGTDIAHPDLTTNMWKNAGEIPGNGLDDDSNGFIDDYDGWDFLNNNNQVSGPELHGTMVAGVISARTNNTLGVCGVAGGFTQHDGCRLMPLGIGDYGPSSAALDDAIVYAADNGARIITMSLRVIQLQSVQVAIDYAANTKGVFIDCSSGNEAGPIAYPASNPFVVAVGATDHDDHWASFSNFGAKLWVCAPGVEIRSTIFNAGYLSSNGTSFSSPMVAATCGLMLSVMPSLSAADLKEILKLTAKDLLAPGFDTTTGWGRINANAAVRHVADSDCNQNGIYDPTDITLGTLHDTNANGVPDECEVINYCPAKLNSLGCLPSIVATGAPSATATGGFAISGTNVLNNKVGLLLYGVNGRASAPFSGATLCVAAPVKRTTAAHSGGAATGSDCSGVFAIDFNAYARGLLGGNPLAALSVVGTRVETQWWGRDPGFAPPNNTTLTDALEFSIAP